MNRRYDAVGAAGANYAEANARSDKRVDVEVGNIFVRLFLCPEMREGIAKRFEKFTHTV